MLQMALIILENWAAQWQMKFIFDKCTGKNIENYNLNSPSTPWGFELAKSLRSKTFTATIVGSIKVSPNAHLFGKG